MKCEQCEIRLLTEGAAATDIQFHLAECPACRHFAAALELGLGQTPKEPSNSLDNKVLQNFRAEMALQRRRSRLRQLLKKALLPAAAVLLLGLWIGRGILSSPNTPSVVAQAPSQEISLADPSWSWAVDLAEYELEALEQDLEAANDSSTETSSDMIDDGNADNTMEYVPLAGPLQAFSEQLFSLECDFDNLYSLDF